MRTLRPFSTNSTFRTVRGRESGEEVAGGGALTRNPLILYKYAFNPFPSKRPGGVSRKWRRFMAGPMGKKEKPTGEIYTLYEQAMKAIHGKAYADALKVLTRIEREFPGDTEVLARVRTFQRICRKLDSTGEPGNSGPETAERHYDWGVIHHNNGRFEEALRHFERSVDLGGRDSAHVYYAMAATLARQGKGRAALDQLKKAIEKGPEARYRASHDPDLAALSDHDEFRKLLRQGG
jgi:tetratricopeptide (TPR) repeat protein